MLNPARRFLGAFGIKVSKNPSRPLPYPKSQKRAPVQDTSNNTSNVLGNFQT